MPVLVGHRRDRHVVEVGVEVLRVLVALGVDRLVEVALPIQQPDPDEGQQHVARRLAVVAGEDAEPARVDRQALVKSELGAEIRDEVGGAQPLGAVAPQRLRVVGVVGRQDAVEGAQECRVVGRIDEPLLVDALQQRLRVVTHRVPQLGIEAREELVRRPVPAVPEVARQVPEPRQPARDVGLDLENERRAVLHSGILAKPVPGPAARGGTTCAASTPRRDREVT